VRWLEGIWTTLRRWWRGLREEVREQVSRVVKRLRRARARVNIPGLGRRRGESLREQIFYHYLNTLDRAEAEGYPRQASETPYEYRQHLAPELSDAEPEIAELTETFVEARYSTHPLSDEALDRLRAAAQRIQDALRRRKADAASEEQDEET
jgi:Asp-tRNA(Asn)/Glu-tRNA(Gln) amidotransferase A subunit family amidase